MCTGAELLRLIGHTDRVNSAAFSPDGRNILSASTDRTVRIWDATTGQLLEVARHSDHVNTAAYSPDGRQFVTATADNFAHLWESQTQPLEVQIGWARAAQFDPLADSERFQLGLPHSGREWPAGQSKCDETAAASYDPQRRSAGVAIEDIVTDIAVEACAPDAAHTDPRTLYQRGRALVAKGDVAHAKEELEQALAQGYAAAGVDLGRLLSAVAGEGLNPSRAVQLYEQAWKKGVTIAGFNLGELYEKGIRRADSQDAYLFSADPAQAWSWYEKAADAGEPNALARLAQRAEADAMASSNTTTDGSRTTNDSSRLLEAFRYYAAAAERARAEDWPDASWRNWRYRRAYLARQLARQGRMREVAETYESVRRQ